MDQNQKSTTGASYDFLVFIGRFQPFHKGHEHVIRQALDLSNKVIIFCGSAHQPRSLRNPWDYHERETMIRNCFSEAENKRLIFVPLMDVAYNDELWVRNIQETVQGLVRAHHIQPHRDAKIGLIGHSKDHTSYYLSLFPQWGSINSANVHNLNSTVIRNELFTKTAKLESLKDSLPVAVSQYLGNFIKQADYTDLIEELEFVNNYKKGWANSPYPPTFVTVDALVVQSGHLLLIKRNARPGAGLLALPGGFVNQNETLVDACLRELREETKLKVPTPVLKGSIKNQHIFDDPNRSSRGRTITYAFLIMLEPNTSLPKVKGSDDAREAFWAPLGELNPAMMFEDHYFIIQRMLGTS